MLRFSSAASLTLHDGAVLLNFSVDDVLSSDAFWGFATGLAGWQFAAAGDSVTYRHYFAAPPVVIAADSNSPWPDVAIDGTLGGIELLTPDYSGWIHQPLYPPSAFVYRNGQLWNGAIRVTNGSEASYYGGQFFFELDFNDGIWQLGDHGQIKLCYAQLDVNGNVAWYCRTYYWLVNKLGYETWQVVTTALPDAAPGSSGGLATTAQAAAIETALAAGSASAASAATAAAAAATQATAAASNTSGLQTWMTAAAGYLSSISASITTALAANVAETTAIYPNSLAAARSQCEALLVQITVNPKPSYTAYGRTYSWTEYQAMLTKQIEDLNRLIAQANPYEIVSRG